VTAAARMQPQKMHQWAAHRSGDRRSMNRCATMFTANSAASRVTFCATRAGTKNNCQPRRQNRRVGGLVSHMVYR
jgi:hypothetical protein